MAPAEAAEVRTAEQEASAAVVGASAVEFLDHADGMLQPGLNLRRDLARAIRRHRPEVVVTLSFREGFYGMDRAWNHVDHLVPRDAVVDAVRVDAHRWVFHALVAEGYQARSDVRCVLRESPPPATHHH